MRKKIEKAGYKITIVIGAGNYVAKGKNKTYFGESIKEIYKQIFK